MSKLIQYHIDEDLFTAQTQTIVNPVNTQGVMGKGLAAEFKKRYPEAFQQYQRECQSRRLRIGRPTLYTKGSPWILHFPTKEWADAPSMLKYIELALTYLVENYQKGKITSLAFPKIGCGEGGLSWKDVGPVLVHALVKMDIPTHIYINAGDAQYQPASFSPYQIADPLPLAEETLEILEVEGSTARMMMICDKRFDPPIYYICLDGQVHAVTVQEQWARLICKNYQNEHSE
jgi:O-acetyl-ADP-ribose deacetylase (regulator of RNase III)